jgi:dTDP-4-dehydrorhamnose 3,5-epimerase
MIFEETVIPGAYLIRLEPEADGRGFFARTWCRKEWERHGLNPSLAQCNVSFNPCRGTLRGMHYQSPHPEVKLVRCTRGALFDVIVDLRRDSPAHGRSFSATLTAENGRMLYVPEGCAHGFLTLQDETEVFYMMSEFYHPDESRGFRWNEPAFAIEWPFEPVVISGRDQNYPDYPI